MVDEHTSAQASRRDVRDSIDRHLDEHGTRMRATVEHRDPDKAARVLSVDDPANEQGAQALMAMAGRSGKGKP